MRKILIVTELLDLGGLVWTISRTTLFKAKRYIHNPCIAKSLFSTSVTLRKETLFLHKYSYNLESFKRFIYAGFEKCLFMERQRVAIYDAHCLLSYLT